MTNSASTSPYQYIITDNSGNILGLPPANVADVTNAPPGTCRFYGVSYTGTLNAAPGMHISNVTSTDCWDLSDNYIEIVREMVDGGKIGAVGGAMMVNVTLDSEPDVIHFGTNSSASAPYAYVITDAVDNILALPGIDSMDFNGASIGECHVWGVSYTGHLSHTTGQHVSTLSSDGCLELSSNYITVLRDTANTANCLMPTNPGTQGITPHSLRLTWDIVSGAQAYEIMLVESGTTNFVKLTSEQDYKRVFGLSDQTTYTWQIRTWCNESGTNTSAWTPMQTFTTGCQMPSGLNQTVNGMSVTLQWDRVPGAAGYQIQGRKAGSSNYKSFLVNRRLTNRTFGNLDPNTTYEWRMRTWCNQSGSVVSDFTPLQSFTTGSSVNKLAQVLPVAEQLPFRMYPIPATEVLYVELNGAQDAAEAITIMDATGRVISRQQSPENGLVTFRLEGLAKGLYFMHIEGANPAVEQFIIQ